MNDLESIQNLQKLLEMNQRNLRHLENQAAAYGGETQAPLNIVNSLYETRQEIHKLEESLRKHHAIESERGLSETESIDLTPLVFSYIERHLLIDQNRLLQEISLDSLSEYSISQSNTVGKRKFSKPKNISEIKPISFSVHYEIGFRHSIFIEERYTVQNTFPYHEDIWKQISLGKAIDIKSSSHSFKEFQEVPVVNTLSKNACENCKGAGKLKCKYCSGAGEYMCIICSGSGTFRNTGSGKCDTCKGSGKVICTACIGSGIGEECKRCHGSRCIMKFSTNGRVLCQEDDNFRITLEAANKDSKNSVLPAKVSNIWTSGVQSFPLSNFLLHFTDGTNDYSTSLRDWILSIYKKIQKGLDIQSLKGIPETVYLGETARSVTVIERGNSTANQRVINGYSIIVTIRPVYTIKYLRDVHYQTGLLFWKKEKVAHLSGELTSDGTRWTKLSENVERED